MVKFKLREQIEIISSGPWRLGITGVIAEAPEAWREIVGNRTENKWCRVVNTQKGATIFYWIEFDEPQFDSDGDGPYYAAEIQEDMIKRRM